MNRQNEIGGARSAVVRPRSPGKPSADARESEDPRSVRSKKIVLDAAVEMFLDKGYDGFSINELVRNTGVAKTTIYRHWATQSHLLIDVITSIPARIEIPDCGNVQDDLIEFFRKFSGSIFNDNKFRALHSIPMLLERAKTDPGLEYMVNFLVSNMFNVFRTILERGQVRGEVRKDRNIETMTNIIFGSLYISQGFFNKIMTEEELIDTVTTTFGGFAARPGEFSAPD